MGFRYTILEANMRESEMLMVGANGVHYLQNAPEEEAMGEQAE